MIYHISQFDPRQHSGGVAQFARDLQKAVPELEYLSVPQMKEPWEAATRANAQWVEDGTLGPDDTVIADGYYGRGLGGKVGRLVIVCHSTYAGWLRDNLIRPHSQVTQMSSWLMHGPVQYQEEAYHQADQIVAVSTSAQEELWSFYGLGSALIYNGVDTGRFSPSESGSGLVEVAGKDYNKGCDIIAELRSKAELDIDTLGFDGDKPDRWSRFDTAVMPSRHEGGPYAQLEAMAMNLKVVAGRTGYFKYDVPDDFALVTEDYYWRTFADMVDASLAMTLEPREWVLENATLEIFCEKWGEFLDV